ncbi:hypothetical protein [Streptomyces sp. NPDC006285]|uniref:hypothetical protein n=1 Tax=Streptomyces sp. NPDC006285 TaxID=3364742 RepID=UPI003698051D
MNDPDNATHHSTAYDSTVGIQAETVHNSNVYFVHPDASPWEKYKVGVRFLEDGVPSRARDVISDAMAHGLDNAEVRFHWALAMLSARSCHDLSTEELQRLHQACKLVPTYAEGEWKDALRVTFELMAMLTTANGEADRVLKQLHALSPRQRDLILHHLDLVLTGGLKDSLWAENREQAEKARFGNDRVRRMWAYFEPDPIPPRTMPPRPSSAIAAQASLPIRAGLFILASGLLTILALMADPIIAIIKLILAVGASLTAAHFGRPWWHQEQQLKTVALRSPAPDTDDPANAEDGFTKRVRHSFNHYFSIRTPRGLSSDEWLARTALVRDSLVVEVAFLYRKSHISVNRVNWLIRYLAEDTQERHNKGTLLAPHRQTPLAAKTLCLLALGTLGTMTLLLLKTAASAGGASHTLLALLGTAGGLWSGRAAALAWLQVRSEQRRLVEETLEYQRQLLGRQAAYEKWTSFLHRTRPSELEMENWLTCDKTLFVDEALHNYQLTWRDLITHTILITPARPYKRGRVRNGPWRYSRYSFRLFLITQDGVREVSTDLDFTDAHRGDEQRSNYRFDALSSVQVTERAETGYELELVLTNGPRVFEK